MRDTRGVAIVLAAGAGRRLGSDEPKAYLPIGGRPVLAVAAAAAVACPNVASVVVAAPAGHEGRAAQMLAELGKPVAVVTGGATRQASVRACLAAAGSAALVAVHDAARPFAPPDLFARVLEALVDADGAVPVLRVEDTLKRVRDGFVVGTEQRDELGLAQTPQAFRAEPLRDALERAAAAGLDFTDDAAALDWSGYRVRAIPGDPGNFKITTLGDLARAEARMTGGARG